MKMKITVCILNIYSSLPLPLPTPLGFKSKDKPIFSGFLRTCFSSLPRSSLGTNFTLRSAVPTMFPRYTWWCTPSLLSSSPCRRSTRNTCGAVVTVLFVPIIWFPIDLLPTREPMTLRLLYRFPCALPALKQIGQQQHPHGCFK